MSQEMPPNNEMSPMEVLEYMAKMGAELSRIATNNQAMLLEAQARGIPVDLSSSERVKKFAPLGEYESLLVKMRNELSWIGTEISEQGVLMTADDLAARLEIMKN